MLVSIIAHVCNTIDFITFNFELQYSFCMNLEYVTFWDCYIDIIVVESLSYIVSIFWVLIVSR